MLFGVLTQNLKNSNNSMVGAMGTPAKPLFHEFLLSKYI